MPRIMVPISYHCLQYLVIITPKKSMGMEVMGLPGEVDNLVLFFLIYPQETYSSIVHDKSSPISAFTMVHTVNEFITKSLSLLEFYPYSFDHASLYHEYVWMEEDDVTNSTVLPHCSAGTVYCKKCKFIDFKSCFCVKV